MKASPPADHDRMRSPSPRRWATAACLLGLAAGVTGASAAPASPAPRVAADLGDQAGTATRPAPASGAARRTSRVRRPARGVGAWHVPHVRSALRQAGVGWFYNWDAGFDYRVPARVDYVPMIWGEAQLDAAHLARAVAHGPDLLTFNEPDHPQQANLTPQRALDLWPTLESSGLRLGSPAVAFGADQPGGWLDQFMSGAAQRGYRVDFVAVHWYGADFHAGQSVRALHDYLSAVHDRYGKRVWLTEFALMRFGPTTYAPQRAQAAFAARATRMLDRLPWLERYAWFAMPAPTHGRSTGLVRPDGSVTAVGRAYAGS